MSAEASNNNPQQVAFIGLGVMGFHMAGHLASAGHQVTVYNRTSSRAEEWLKKFSGSSAPTPAEAASGASIVFACVGNDDDVRAISTASDGVFAGMQAGSVFVDHTTASAELARELDAAARAGLNPGVDPSAWSLEVAGIQDQSPRAVFALEARIDSEVGGRG